MTVTYEEFQKLDIRIGTVIAAERVEGTDKLIKFEFDLGSEKRTVVGGWAVSYPDPSVLISTQLVVLTNLEPRVIRGVESQGMILSAVEDDKPVALHPDRPVELGSIVR
jgi:methionine--tRNA ligase beta chain